MTVSEQPGAPPEITSIRGATDPTRRVRIGATLVLWYLAMLLIAVVSKYMDTGWGDLLKPRAGGTHGLSAISQLIFIGSRLLQVYRADIIQTFLLVAALAVVGSWVLRIRVSIVLWASLFVAVVVAFGEWLALRQTGIPLTYANLVISIDWAWDHPDVITSVLPWSGIVLALAGAAIYASIPSLTMRIARRTGAVLGTYRTIVYAFALGITFALALALITGGGLIPKWSQTLSPTEGFWSSTIASLADLDTESPVNLPVEPSSDLLRQYSQIAYPLGGGGEQHLATPPLGPLVPRHVIVVVLETAPRQYYPLASDTSFAIFHAMAAQSIVSERHFTNRPYTLFAIYGILTGTYPRPGASIGEYGDFRMDGLAATLGARGYETTYIDSYKVDWGYHYRLELQRRGFQTILDTAGFRPPSNADDFQTAVARERWSITEALDRVRDAQDRNTKALVVVATTLGHFPWRSPSAMKHASSSKKLHAMAMSLDSAVGTLIHGLDSLHLRDSTIVVVTGDHGLRYSAEFQSFGSANMPGSDVEFNVPFMLYAPGIVRKRIDIPYATSHVDIAPTLYYLLGVPTGSLLLHGGNMFDSNLARRAVFLMNTGIYPVDAFELEGHRFTFNHITKESTITPAMTDSDRAQGSWDSARIQSLLDSANHVFNLTAAQFLSRGAHGQQ